MSNTLYKGYWFMTGILPNRFYISDRDDSRLARVDLHRHGVVEITSLVREGVKIIGDSLCDWIGLSTRLAKYDRQFLPLEASWQVLLPHGQNIRCQSGVLSVNGETKVNARSTIDELRLLGIKFGRSPQSTLLALSVNSDGVNIRDLKTELKLFSLVYDDHGFMQVKGNPAVLSEIEQLNMNGESLIRELAVRIPSDQCLHPLEPRVGASSSLSIRADEDCLFRFRDSVFYYDHRSHKLTMQNGLRQKTVQLQISELRGVSSKDTKTHDGDTPHIHKSVSAREEQVTRDLSVKAA